MMGSELKPCPISELLRYCDLSAMDKQVYQDGECIGWEKTPKFMKLIDDARKHLSTRPSTMLDAGKVLKWIAENWHADDDTQCCLYANDLEKEINSGNLNAGGEGL